MRTNLVKTDVWTRVGRSGWALAILLAAAGSTWAAAPAFEPKPKDPYFEKFYATRAPVPGGPLLRTGDRLAICGDSITEQKMYSRIIETYLTACAPELKVSVRQYGWSGETAEGFLNRMTNDCLRFTPTVATTCYGMNDFKYRPFDDANAAWYRDRYTAVARAFKAAGCRVVLGSPGCVGKVASWVKSGSGTVEDHNLSLCAFRNIDLRIATQEQIRFADVFWPMFTSSYAARQKYGAEYAVAGQDGVHPGWAGQLVMAYVYLRALGLDGSIGRIEVDLKSQSAHASAGHQLDRAGKGEFTFTSRRYPFCAEGELNRDNSLRSGMTLVPFNPELNRFVLVAKGGKAKTYQVTWGPTARTYTAEQLTKGVNLADDFVVNPFSAAFKKVDEAVAAKQAFETKQIKEQFHGAAGRADMAAVVARTETERDSLVGAVEAAFVPVTHTLRIEPK